MTKSQLIAALVGRNLHLEPADVGTATHHLLAQVSNALACGERVEVRGFGCFVLRYRTPRMGRNPKTGALIALSGRNIPHFTPGKSLRERVNGVEAG